MPEIGQTLSHYQIVEKIGQGGMGEVFLAEDTSLHRKVALKFLPLAMQRDDIALKRFIREAHSAAALDHPYICHINEIVQSDNCNFIVMEYVNGQTLKGKLLKGPLPIDELLRISIEIAEALETAHRKGIIHRDIKPANIMLTQSGHVKVTDFGLAKQIISSGAKDSVAETVTELTSSASTVGTLAYMSPEQLLGRAADVRSDVWSFGVTLYEMASGSRPFNFQATFELTSAILNQSLPPLPSKVPVELRTVIQHCLEKEPENRYQNMGEVKAGLAAIRAGTEASRKTWPSTLSRYRWPVLIAFLAFIAVALVGLNIGGLREWQKSGDSDSAATVSPPPPQRSASITTPTESASNPPPVPAASSKLPAIAVLDFANLQNNPNFEGFQTGIAEAFTESLVNSKRFRTVERNQLDEVQKELELNSTSSVDPSTAQKLGRLIGAQYLVVGSFQVFEGEILINARLLRVETGEITQTGKITGKTSEALSLPASLADKFLEGIQ